MKTDLTPTASEIDSVAPIDFELLKSGVADNGPLRLSRANNPYEVSLTPTPCKCSNEGCTNELVVVSRQHGVFEMQWVISKEELLNFESLDEFFNHVASGKLQDSRGERMIAEEHIDRIFCKLDDFAHEIGCPCPTCLAPRVNEDARNMFLLSQLSSLLAERQGLLDDARSWDNENLAIENQKEESGEDESGRLEEWIEDAFEIGYALGRNFSEYSGRAKIEPLAMLGVTAQETKAKREAAAGQKSRELRENRRADLLDKMEAIAKRSPDIVRLGPETVAKLAIEDCIKGDPALWSVGRGQVSEYLGEMRRGGAPGEADAAMKVRYEALFGGKTA